MFVQIFKIYCFGIDSKDHTQKCASCSTYITRMVYKARQIAAFGGVYDRAWVDAEHVAAADALRVVVLLADVRHGLTNDFAHVFDNELLGTDLLERKQAPVVDI